MKADKLIKITYKRVELSAELQQRLDDTFDFLFEETRKTFKNSEGEREQILANTYDNFMQNNN